MIDIWFSIGIGVGGLIGTSFTLGILHLEAKKRQRITNSELGDGSSEMIQHYVKVSKILMWIKKQRESEEDKKDEDYIDLKEWDEGYDTCLDHVKDLLEDFPLEDDEDDVPQEESE